MKLSDFHLLNVPGDGGCFFHSIVTILDVDKNPDKYKQKFNLRKESFNMRKRCISWLKKNLNYKIKGTGLSIRHEIDDAVNEEIRLSEENNRDPHYTTINEYLTYMLDDSSYAGQIEIYATAELLKRNIRVYTSEGNTPNTPLKNIGLGYELNKDSNKDIFNDNYMTILRRQVTPP